MWRASKKKDSIKISLQQILLYSRLFQLPPPNLYISSTLKSQTQYNLCIIYQDWIRMFFCTDGVIWVKKPKYDKETNITVSRRLQTLDFFSSSLISSLCGFLSHGFFCSLAKNKTKEVCCVLWWEELGRAAGGTNTRSHIRFWSDPETCTDRMTDQRWLFIIIFTESTFSGAYGWQFTTFSSLSVQSCRRHLE